MDSSDESLVRDVIISEKRQVALNLLQKNKMARHIEHNRQLAIAKRNKNREVRVAERKRDAWASRNRAISEIRAKELELANYADKIEKELLDMEEIISLVDDMIWEVIMTEIELPSEDAAVSAITQGSINNATKKRCAQPTRVSKRQKQKK